MTKRRASLKGKGHSILVGGEEAEESPPAMALEVEMPPEAGEGGPMEGYTPEEAVEQPGALENETSTTGAPAEEASPTSLPAIEHYYSEEEPDPPELTPPSVEPLASSTPVSVEPPVEEADEEVDWSPMLEDEITTAKLPAEENSMSPLPTIEYHYPEEKPAVPESELPAIEQPATIEPTPVSDTPAAPPVSEALPPPSPAATEPPPDVPTSLPDVRIGGLLAGMSLTEMEKLAPPGPGFEEAKVRETTKAPPKELTLEEEEIVIRRVSRNQRRELFDRISQLYEEAPNRLAASGLKARREEALLLLSEARDVVLEDPRQFDEAEQKVWQVEAIIANAADVERWSHHYGNRLIAYLTTWFAALMALIIFFNPLADRLVEATSSESPSFLPIVVPPLLFTMLWGGIGGIVGGLYSLWKHIAERQDFDKQYTVWYTLQPISGLVLGGIIHVVIMTGFLSMFSQVASPDVTTTQGEQAVFWFPALLAVVAGFRQNFAYALLDRIVELIGQRPQEPG
jgi:hypothetical protein